MLRVTGVSVNAQDEVGKDLLGETFGQHCGISLEHPSSQIMLVTLPFVIVLLWSWLHEAVRIDCPVKEGGVMKEELVDTVMKEEVVTVDIVGEELVELDGSASVVVDIIFIGPAVLVATKGRQKEFTSSRVAAEGLAYIVLAEGAYPPKGRRWWR